MPFYPPDQRRRAFSQDPGRGAVPPNYRQNFGPPYEQRRPDNPAMYSQQQPPGYPQQPPGYPQQQQLQQMQQQGPRRRFPENFDTMMNHAGKLSEGINIVRQIGSFFNMFR